MRRLLRALPMLVLIGAAIWIAETGHFAALDTLNDAEAVASDGDSLRAVDGGRLRLHAIDAPELGQSCSDAAGASWDCGEWAKARLAALIDGAPLDCAILDRDRYGRDVAECSTPNTPDIGALLVREGAAVALRIDGRRPYADEEEAARQSRRGIWQGKFEQPVDWRAGHVRRD